MHHNGISLIHQLTVYRVFYPENKVTALETNDHLHVEQDGGVKTQ